MGAAEEINVRHADVLARSARLLIVATRGHPAQDRNLMRERQPSHPWRHYSARAAPATPNTRAVNN